MKKLYLILMAFVLAGSSMAQDTINKIARSAKPVEATPDTVKPWKITGVGSVNMNQAYFVNWAAGGESSLGLAAFANLQAVYKHKNHAWLNNLDLAYGFQLNAPGSADKQFRKTDDRIEFTSNYGYKVAPKWYASILVNFKTQFSYGYNYPDDSTIISKFMAPGYLVAGIGMTWVPTSYFNVFMSPASGRFTFVLDKQLSDSGAFGVERGKSILGQFGPYVRAAFNKDLAKNINLNTTLDLFTNYLENFGNINVNWNMLFTLKVNKWLATSISASLIYDDKVMITDLQGKTGPRTQFKENIGVGISYKIH
jgi:hypothetical protein